MLDKKNLINNEETAVLVGVVLKDQTEQEVQEYLEELAFLAETAGAKTIKRFLQKLSHPDSRTYVGKGKLEQIKNYVESHEVTLVIFDDELSGSQISNIEKAVNARTIDRSDLILDIFARRAKTAQAKA
ncbi:MAG TPA: GTPase HflX, partial [Flavisolibacter sp.]|nr:GTPase HflX [Flavisolibacter sp.]